MQLNFPKSIIENAVANSDMGAEALCGYYQSATMVSPGFAVELRQVEDIARLFAEIGVLAIEDGLSVEFRVLARTMITEKMNYGIRLTWSGWSLIG